MDSGLAVILSLCAQVVVFSLSVPWLLFNAVLLSLELWAFFASRASGRQGLLWWMPLLVLIWANLDWHFVIGLLVLLLFMVAVVAEKAWGNKLHARGERSSCH